MVSALLQRGFAVRVLEKPGASVKHLPQNNIEIVWADITKRESLNQAISGCSVVFHLAADPNLWRKSRSHYHQVNFQGAKNVIEIALDLGVKRIVHASTESILPVKIKKMKLLKPSKLALKMRLAAIAGRKCVPNYSP